MAKKAEEIIEDELIPALESEDIEEEVEENVSVVELETEDKGVPVDAPSPEEDTSDIPDEGSEEEVVEAEAVAEVEAPKDPDGVVTLLSPEKYDQLMRIWATRGSPRQFVALGKTWSVYNDGDGKRFVAVPPSGFGEYGSLSTSR